jgi:hypothetical protein
MHIGCAQDVAQEYPAGADGSGESAPSIPNEVLNAGKRVGTFVALLFNC